MIAKLDSPERTYKELSVSEIILLLISYVHFDVYFWRLIYWSSSL